MRKIILLAVLGAVLVGFGGIFTFVKSAVAQSPIEAVNLNFAPPMNTPTPTPFVATSPWQNNGGMRNNQGGGMMGNYSQGMTQGNRDQCGQMGNSYGWGYGSSGSNMLPTGTGNGALNYTGDVSFAADIQPIFNANCTSCHGGVQNLSLESYENLSHGSINGQVIIPGNPEQSRLIQYVAGGYMPYGGPQLSPDQIQMLINWVAVGAPNN